MAEVTSLRQTPARRNGRKRRVILVARHWGRIVSTGIFRRIRSQFTNASDAVIARALFADLRSYWRRAFRMWRAVLRHQRLWRWYYRLAQTPPPKGSSGVPRVAKGVNNHHLHQKIDNRRSEPPILRICSTLPSWQPLRLLYITSLAPVHYSFR
jgi:hypothetical protein